MNDLYWVTLDQCDGAEIPFPSERAFTAAQDWYNDSQNTKKKMINYCADRRVTLGELSDDFMLVDCWADLAMATFAWQQHDPKMIAMIGMQAREVSNNY